MFDDLIVGWEHAADGGGAIRFAALLLPGLAVAIFVMVSTTVMKGSVSGGAIETAIFGLIVFDWVNWRGSVARRRDRMTAEKLAPRGDWDETIEFSRRPVATIRWRAERTVWIATDRRLLEVGRGRRRAPDDPPGVLQSVGYERITEIQSVKSRGGGETARLTTVVFALGHEERELTFSPTAADALLRRAPRTRLRHEPHPRLTSTSEPLASTGMKAEATRVHGQDTRPTAPEPTHVLGGCEHPMRFCGEQQVTTAVSGRHQFPGERSSLPDQGDDWRGFGRLLALNARG